METTQKPRNESLIRALEQTQSRLPYQPIHLSSMSPDSADTVCRNGAFSGESDSEQYQTVLATDRAKALQGALATLKTKHRDAVVAYYGIGSGQESSLQKVADRSGVHQTTIKRRCESALKRLRKTGAADALKEFLE